MGLIRNGIYGIPVIGVGFLGSLPVKPRNFAQNALTWNTAIREYTSFPNGRFQTSFILPLKYGGLSCTMLGTASLAGVVSAVGVLTTTVNGSSALGASISGGVNLDVDLTGEGTVTATLQAKGWVTCRIQIGANPTAFDVAQAVWGAVSAQYNVPGTMGEAAQSGGGGGGGTDWTTTEKNQIRKRLGLDGTSSAPVAVPDLALQSTLTSVHASVNAAPSASDIATAILDANDIDPNMSVREAMKLMLASLAGKSTVSGNTVTFRDTGDSKTRITATVDESGNRTSIAYDKS